MNAQKLIAGLGLAALAASSALTSCVPASAGWDAAPQKEVTLIATDEAGNPAMSGWRNFTWKICPSHSVKPCQHSEGKHRIRVFLPAGSWEATVTADCQNGVAGRRARKFTLAGQSPDTGHSIAIELGDCR